ncbi:MAG: glycerophosphodiester phosphodiesterase [Christensenellales bacterium]|jgi:glycerophosphoryl diester phosphodiesterase
MRVYTLHDAQEYLKRKKNGALVIDGQEAASVEAALPLETLRGGQFILLHARAQNNQEALRLCYAGVRFYCGGELLINRSLVKQGTEPPDAYLGYVQFHGDGMRIYDLRWIVPFGVDRAEIIFTVRNGAKLTFDELTVEVVDMISPQESGKGGIKLVSHLGITGYAPKNTMPAFRLACRARYRECVTNTNHTSDGHLVTLHDNTIDATSNGQGAIREMTLAQARRYDYGSYAHPIYAGCEIPELADVLELMARSRVRPVLRLGDFVGESEKYLADIYRLCEHTGHIGCMTAKAFSGEVLEAFALIAGDSARYGLCTREITEEKARWLKKLGKDVYFDVRHTHVTDEMLETAHEYDIPIESWIVNEYDKIIALHRKGVSGFTTDFFPMDGCFLDE